MNEEWGMNAVEGIFLGGRRLMRKNDGIPIDWPTFRHVEPGNVSGGSGPSGRFPSPFPERRDFPAMMDFLLNRFRRIGRRAIAVMGMLPEPAAPDPARSASSLAHVDRPVFLLPGLGARRSCDVLEHRLARDGFLVCKMGMGGLEDLARGRDIEGMAESLGSAIERQRIRYGLGRFAIVAVDTAGLVASYYVKRLGGNEGCAALVTLGTPHRGVPRLLSSLPRRLVLPTARQLVADSPFVRRLQSGPYPEGVHVASIYARNSRRYPFPCCRLPEESGEDGVNVEVTASTFDGILTRGDVYALARREVLAGFGMGKECEDGTTASGAAMAQGGPDLVHGRSPDDVPDGPGHARGEEGASSSGREGGTEGGAP